MGAPAMSSTDPSVWAPTAPTLSTLPAPYYVGEVGWVIGTPNLAYVSVTGAAWTLVTGQTVSLLAQLPVSNVATGCRATVTGESVAALNGDYVFRGGSWRMLSAIGDRTRAASWVPAATGWQRIDWDTSNALTGLTVPTASRLQVAAAGRFEVEARIAMFTPATSGAAFVAAIYRSGTIVASGQESSPSSTGASITATARASVVLDLAAGEYVEAYVYLNTASAYTFRTDQSWLRVKGMN